MKLNTDVDPFDDKIVLVTDRTKIIQIVSNIVNNAIKFTKEGKIDVLFRLHTKMQNVIDEWTAATCHHSGHAFTMKPGELFESLAVARERVRIIPTMPSQRWLSVSIEDTGCGMKPEELVEMLKPYTQSSDESNKVVQGTGLGLFICVSLCHQLSGFLACASTPGKGTAFHIGIPVDLDDSKPDAKPKAVEKMEEPSEGRIPIRGPIMLVDDNKVNVKILCRQLELELQKVGLESVELVVATGGAEAVETYIDREPSLCIIDYHMPDIDGVDATKAIRQYEYERGLAPSYIFSYTADATEEAEALLRECGVNAIMAKPPPTGFVQDLVRRLDVAKKS